MIGDDLLTMEEKERLIKTIEEVNNDKEIITEWMREENARLKHAGEMRYAKDEGIEEKEIELIKNMLLNKLNYEVISNVSGKTIDEIKEIENSMEE